MLNSRPRITVYSALILIFVGGCLGAYALECNYSIVDPNMACGWGQTEQPGGGITCCVPWENPVVGVEPCTPPGCNAIDLDYPYPRTPCGLLFVNDAAEPCATPIAMCGGGRYYGCVE